jgi:uncharacterized protein (UPF0333 family)
MRFMKNILRSLRRFGDDTQASMTVEFVVAVPLLMLWFVGSFVFWDGFRSRSHASKAAYTVADIMSRYTQTIDNSKLDDLFALQTKLLPRANGAASMRITSVCYREDSAGNNGEFSIHWSRGLGGAQPMQLIDLPLSIMPTMASGDTIILTETWVPWQPIVDWVGITNQVWRTHLVNRPRFKQIIPNSDINSDNFCPPHSSGA